jgi:hypothetical protein
MQPFSHQVLSAAQLKGLLERESAQESAESTQEVAIYWLRVSRRWLRITWRGNGYLVEWFVECPCG